MIACIFMCVYVRVHEQGRDNVHVVSLGGTKTNSRAQQASTSLSRTRCHDLPNQSYHQHHDIPNQSYHHYHTIALLCATCCCDMRDNGALTLETHSG